MLAPNFEPTTHSPKDQATSTISIFLAKPGCCLWSPRVFLVVTDQQHNKLALFSSPLPFLNSYRVTRPKRRVHVSPRAAAAKEPVNGACGFCNVDTCPIKSGLRPPANPVLATWQKHAAIRPLFRGCARVCLCVPMKGCISSLLLVFFCTCCQINSMG